MSEPPPPTQPPHSPQPGEPERPPGSGEPYYPPPQPWGGQPDPGQSGGYPQGGYASTPNPDQYQQGGYPQGGYPTTPNPDPYQQGGYPQGGYGGAPGGHSPSLSDRLGARVLVRPEPRFGISLAAAGIALAIVGVLVWSIGYIGDGFNIAFGESGRPKTSGDERRFLGAGLAAVLAAAGYALMIIRRRGPLATAGAIAAAGGVPIALIFVTLDFTDVFRGDPPFNLDLTFLLSVVIWLVTYLAVPGGRGRAFFLGLAALNLASYFEYKAAGNAAAGLAVSTIAPSGINPSSSGTGGVAAVGLIFGLGYYAIAAFLDRRGMKGAAVALVVAGFVTTVTGVLGAARPFGQVGTGVLLVVLGAALSWYGGYFGRRFTTWAWAAGLIGGVGLIVQKALPDSVTGIGITLIVVGAVVVAVAQIVSSTTHEAPEVVEQSAAPAGVGYPGGNHT